MMAMLTQADGTSVITETIFENRFMHAQELARMGADILMKGATAVVRGPSKLSGAPVMATDLRASMGLIIAGLAAEHTTELSRIYHLDRGYEALDAKLSGWARESSARKNNEAAGSQVAVRRSSKNSWRRYLRGGAATAPTSTARSRRLSPTCASAAIAR